MLTILWNQVAKLWGAFNGEEPKRKPSPEELRRQYIEQDEQDIDDLLPILHAFLKSK